MKSLRWIILTVLLAACASVSPPSNSSGQIQEDTTVDEMGEPGIEVQKPADESMPVRADLKDLGPAPELVNDVWVNTDQPLRLADLRGKVVLLDMWTFG